MLAQGLRVSSGNFAMFSDAPCLVAGEEVRRRTRQTSLAWLRAYLT
jgi:hypothetical protein